MNKSLLILDFDGTLFNTAKFIEDLKVFFKKEYSVDFLDKYKNSKNDAGAYDYYQHLKLEGITKSDDKIKKDFFEYFSDKDYLYDDVKVFLENYESDILVVTLGVKSFQRLKIEQALHDIDLQYSYTETSKAKYLENEISYNIDDKTLEFRGETYKKISMIDDRVDSFPDIKSSSFKKYRILREGGRYNSQKADEDITNIKLLNQFMSKKKKAEKVTATKSEKTSDSNSKTNYTFDDIPDKPKDKTLSMISLIPILGFVLMITNEDLNVKYHGALYTLVYAISLAISTVISICGTILFPLYCLNPFVGLGVIGAMIYGFIKINEGKKVSLGDLNKYALRFMNSA